MIYSLASAVFSCAFVEGFFSTRYCHVLVTKHRVWIGNWIYWNLRTRNYKEL
jgi:hypothetical protein